MKNKESVIRYYRKCKTLIFLDINHRYYHISATVLAKKLLEKAVQQFETTSSREHNAQELFNSSFYCSGSFTVSIETKKNHPG